MNFKKIFMVSVGLLLGACQLAEPRKIMWQEAGDQGVPAKAARVAVMLPLSDKSAEVGKSFQKSMMMALQDRPSSHVELMFFDTKGTVEGTEEAWDNAKMQQPDLVIGPVMAEEVQALKNAGVSVPVISFTTDHSVLESQVYSLGVLIPSQVDKVVESMCVGGQRKIAVFGPENKAGELTMNALSESVKRCPGMELSHVALYDPETVDFAPIVLKVIPTPVDPRKKNLTEKEKELLQTPMEERIDFDAVFIYDSGVKLQQLTALLAYYDVTPKVVPFYGLAVWQTSKDRSLIGGYFAGTPQYKTEMFTRKYQQSFGEQPQKIAALGYDAVALADALADGETIHFDQLLKETGFNGVNGRFRLLSDGTNERLLELFQITPAMKAKRIIEADAEFKEPDVPFIEPVAEESPSEEEVPTEEVENEKPVEPNQESDDVQ